MRLEIVSNEKRPWGASWVAAHTQQIASALIVAAERRNAAATAHIVSCGNLDCLLPAAAKQDNNGRTALSIALHNGDKPTACLLLAAGATAGDVVSEVVRPVLEKCRELLKTLQSEIAASAASGDASVSNGASAATSDGAASASDGAEPKVIHVTDSGADRTEDGTADDSGSTSDSSSSSDSVSSFEMNVVERNDLDISSDSSDDFPEDSLKISKASKARKTRSVRRVKTRRPRVKQVARKR